MGGVAQADPAEAELAEVRARAAAAAAPVIPACLELGSAALPHSLRCLRHQPCSLSGGCCSVSRVALSRVLASPLPPDSSLGASDLASAASPSSPSSPSSGRTRLA